MKLTPEGRRQQRRVLLLMILLCVLALILTGCTTVRIENWKLRTDYCKTGGIRNELTPYDVERGIGTTCKYPVSWLGS